MSCSLTWLSPASRNSAEAKLANMVDLIGYPKLVLNNTWLDAVYSDVDVSDDDYLVNRKTNLSEFWILSCGRMGSTQPTGSSYFPLPA